MTDLLRESRTAVVLGSYHPYDRILPQSSILRSESYGWPAYEGIRGNGVVGTTLAQLSMITIPSFGRAASRDGYLRLHADALNAVADRYSDGIAEFGTPQRDEPEESGIL